MRLHAKSSPSSGDDFVIGLFIGCLDLFLANVHGVARAFGGAAEG